MSAQTTPLCPPPAASLPYANAGLRIGAIDATSVRALQHDLRALGYLQQGIDGVFRHDTDLAVRRLQYDLLHNDGCSTAGDGNAPVADRDFNRRRITAETGVVDAGLAACIGDLLADPRVPALPHATDAAAANAAARAAIAEIPAAGVPLPFLLAIFQQESNAAHYAEPVAGDTDSFVTLGLDCGAGAPTHVTSRGYGIGQYTLFHHPPRPEELRDLITDPAGNARRALALLRDKQAHFLRGPGVAEIADDLRADHGAAGPMPCRYGAGDTRYQRDCHACALAAGRLELTPDTPVYAGSTTTYRDATHYPPVTYRGVPDRADFQCDWPYAVRRYNGSGGDSYHYQARVLLHLAAGPAA